MSKDLIHKQSMSRRRKLRVRKIVKGSQQRPRLAVHISNMHITAQIVDDSQSKTLAYATSIGQKLEGTMSDKATKIGEQIAQKAIKLKISKVAYDRGAKKYHGRVSNLAGAARKAGLEF